MRILFVAAEASPLARVGGLAEVIGSLPKALRARGHDARLMLPQYDGINLNEYSLITLKDRFEVALMSRIEPASLKVTTLKSGIPVYLIENTRYFGGKEIYGRNDLERFLFFSRAVLEILPQLDWQPQIIHSHDWHISLLVMWLKKTHSPYILIFTIHNLAYQGAFDETFLVRSNLKPDWEEYPAGAPKPPLNFLSQGILWADLVTTVSETYAKEIVTPEHGTGLDFILRYRQKDLLGIVNGIDYDEYNPETDPYLQANYNSSTPERRVINKLALQKRANLPQDAEIPLIGMVQRLEEQKGFDILIRAAHPLLQETTTQLVILGKGSEYYQSLLRQVASQYPQQVALFTEFDDLLAHLIYAGGDLFLMPSRFEPCGLGQLIALRYGALPVVRHTGGLVDTVSEFTLDLKEGSGFVFRDYTPEALITAVKKGIAAFSDKGAWYRAIRRVMQLDFSWQASALKYEATYRRLLETRLSP